MKFESKDSKGLLGSRRSNKTSKRPKREVVWRLTTFSCQKVVWKSAERSTETEGPRVHAATQTPPEWNPAGILAVSGYPRAARNKQVASEDLGDRRVQTS